MGSGNTASGPAAAESLATLVGGDPERRAEAAAFAVRFVLTAAVAVGIPVGLFGFAAATPAAVTSIFLQLGRPLPVRWRSRLVAGALLAALLGGGAALGVLLSGPVAAVVAIALALIVALAARGSAIAALARDPLLIIFIFMGGLPSTPAGALPALIGAALAAVIVVAITGLLERQPTGEAADRVAGALDGVAEALERGGGAVPAVDALRTEVGALATPLGSAGRAQALAGLMANVERQQQLLLRIAHALPADSPDMDGLAEQDRDCARALRGEAPPPDEQQSLDRVGRRMISTPNELLELARGPEEDPLARIDDALLPLDLELTVANAIGLTRQACGRPTPLRDRLTRQAPPPAVSRSRARIAASRVLALISLRSAATRDALRLGAATGLAVAAIEFLPIERGYWVMMTAVIVLRASSQTTVKLGRGQLIGTFAGFALALIPIALAAGATVQVAVAVLALLLFAFAARAGATLLGPAALTVVFVMALGQLTGSGFVIGSERVVDVALGIAIAIVAAAIIWPGGRERLTAHALAESFATAATLIRVTGAWLVHRMSNADTGTAWRAALAAGARAEEALTALAAAPLEGRADYGSAVRLHAIATRIRFQSGEALRNTDRLAPGETGVAELIDAEVDRMAERFEGIASMLAANELGSATPAPPDDGAGELRAALTRRAHALGDPPADDETEAQFVHAVLVWHWLADVAREADAAAALVGVLKPVGPA